MSGTMRAKRGMVAALVGIGVVVLLGSAAYSCVPKPGLKLTPNTGTVGTSFTVSGSTFDAGQTVKVWWGGAGQTLLGQATVTESRSFTISAKVPQSASGSQIVSATQGGGDPVNAVFKVTGGEPAQAAPSNFQGQPENADGAAGLESAPAAQPAPAPAAQPAPAPSRTAVQPAPASAPVRQTSRTPAPAAAPAPAPAAAPVPEAAAAPEAAPAPAAAPEQEAFRPAPPVTQPLAPASSDRDRGTSPWLLAPLALLALGSFAVGTSLFLNERKRVRTEA